MSFGRGISLAAGSVQVRVTAGRGGEFRVHTSAAKPGRQGSRLSRTPFLRGFFAFGRRPVLPALLVALVLMDLSSLLESGTAEAVDRVAGWVGLGLLAALLVTRLFFLGDLLRYHAAEHMAINAYEAGQELTCENIAAASRTHPRCGTMWAIYLVLIGIPCALLIPFTSIAFFLSVSTSYELFLASGKHAALRWLNRAGLWLQRVATTAEPEQRHIELALQCMTRLQALSGNPKSRIIE